MRFITARFGKDEATLQDGWLCRARLTADILCGAFKRVYRAWMSADERVGVTEDAGRIRGCVSLGEFRRFPVNRVPTRTGPFGKTPRT